MPFFLLLSLLSRVRKVFFRLLSRLNTLAESVWGDHIDQVDNFDFIYAQIKNVRKKLKEKGANIEIKAVYGFGYKLVVE